MNKTINVDQDLYDFVLFVKDKHHLSTIKQAATWALLNDTLDIYAEYCREN